MYSEACEAQGMTLADLISRSSITAIDDSETVSLLWLFENAPVNFKTNAHIKIYNDIGDDWEYVFAGQTDTLKSRDTLSFYSTDEGKQIQGSGVSVTFVNSDRAGSPQIWSECQYYKQFGLAQVELPKDCTYVKGMWTDVCTRVNEKYWKRYLSCETLEEWQVELQVLTDAIVRRYERALRLYKANADAIEKEFGARQVTEYGDLKDTSSQTKDSKTNTTVSATPDQKINDDETYAGTTSNGSSNAGTTEHTRTGKITVTQVGGDSMLGAINDNVAKWHDIETELVDEYAHVFMSYIWS